MIRIWYFRKSNCSATRYKFVSTFIVVHGLTIILCTILFISFGEARQEDWVQPCQMSREACDNVCGVTFRKPLFWACHRTTGYCLCPINSKPEKHCRRPRTKRETLACRTSVCVNLKKKTKKQNKSIKGTPLTDKLKEFGGNGARAMICYDAQRGNKTYCSCFTKSSAKSHSVHVKPRQNGKSADHGLITNYKEIVI